MKRRKAREKAFQILFQMDKNDIKPEDAIFFAAEDAPIDDFTEDIVYGVIEHKSEIDELISSHLTSWSLNRIAAVERTLLRIATYEIKFNDEIPVKVSINEAVDVAKEYGEENSGKFINGVLSKLVNEEE